MVLLALIPICFNSPAFTYIRNLSTSSIKLFFSPQICFFVDSNTRVLGFPMLWAPHKAVGTQR